MQTITLPKQKFLQMQLEIQTLRNSNLYQRLLQFQNNISQKKYTREDLGF